MTDNTWPTVDTELIDDVTLYSAKLIKIGRAHV